MLKFVHFSGLDRNLYTIRAVPFTDIRSIRRHTPALGWQYIIVVLSSGEFLLMNLKDFMFIVFFFSLSTFRCFVLQPSLYRPGQVTSILFYFFAFYAYDDINIILNHGAIGGYMWLEIAAECIHSCCCC